MPTDEKILGFGNRWYKEAIRNAINFPLMDNLNIKIVTAPYFLATKLEAFKDRGKMDFFASHDFEDIVSLLDGRLEIQEEINQAETELRVYLANSFLRVFQNRSFHDALPGHFIQYNDLRDSRIKLFLEKIQQIIQVR
jgi:hypothetical protein